MKNHLRILPSLILTLIAVIACNDDTSSIGSSLVTDKSEITIDSAFTVSGTSSPTTELRARTLTQLLGSIDARRYGSLTSDFVTQLMPSEAFDTTGVTPQTVDSIALYLRFYGNKITGDSMTPMGMKVYALKKQLPTVLTSTFRPDGYYDPSEPLSAAIYSSTNLYSDSLETFNVHLIQANLPIEIGQKYVEAYRANPDIFSSPDAFAAVMPGIYVANSFGAGRVTNIFNTRVILYYHSNTRYTNSLDQERDTTIYSACVIAASTPEVLTNNNLSFNIDPSLTAMAAQCPMLVSPLGYESRITFPTQAIIDAYRHATQKAMGVVNSLTFRLPVEKIENDYGINPPPHILLLPEDQRDKFFAEQMIPDNVTSFLADYDSSTGSYYFSNLRPYLMELINGSHSQADIDRLSHLAVVPVEVSMEQYVGSNYQTTIVVTAVGPHIEGPAMAKLNLNGAKIKLTYSTETIKF
ncbi:MAG: DUF4270 domain-containing protein [Pseudoflavonifractor sp.]|nr:DUF4270 domain-containing protein [Alloprevotella sp.]MCM1116819.1 DUF4270 domain-containing protein [Pseudoflavonifractor sp.]